MIDKKKKLFLTGHNILVVVIGWSNYSVCFAFHAITKNYANSEFIILKII